ncbi:MAG: phosphoribosylformylglycinamidine synthase subunit PurQ [Candidatus Saganbacteria bacterium]|nr:phosphoribosylformylglycinamidine synthase subunit PurQ [Candidatus Saganbacteria bacterium]
MKFGVVVFPGSNCDRDCFHVAKNVLKENVDFIWHDDGSIAGHDCIILPGGFSYGDYLRTGAIARFSPIMKAIEKYASAGGLVIGICNGFQILLEAGLLPGAMMRNKDLHFICKYVNIKVENTNTPFTNLGRKGQVLKIPIAHNEGNYYADEATLKKLIARDLIVFRYCDERGKVSPDSNPNGSLDGIAGICNEGGNVLGMMPHPERSSEGILGSVDGKVIFDSIVNWLRSKK